LYVYDDFPLIPECAAGFALARETALLIVFKVCDGMDIPVLTTGR